MKTMRCFFKIYRLKFCITYGTIELCIRLHINFWTLVAVD